MARGIRRRGASRLVLLVGAAWLAGTFYFLTHQHHSGGDNDEAVAEADMYSLEPAAVTEAAKARPARHARGGWVKANQAAREEAELMLERRAEARAFHSNEEDKAMAAAARGEAEVTPAWRLGFRCYAIRSARQPFWRGASLVVAHTDRFVRSFYVPFFPVVFGCGWLLHGSVRQAEQAAAARRRREDAAAAAAALARHAGDAGDGSIYFDHHEGKSCQNYAEVSCSPFIAFSTHAWDPKHNL